MRLGQLARKLKVSQGEIAENIQNEFNVNIELGPNVKLDDTHVEFLMKKHQPIEPKTEEKSSDAEAVEDKGDEVKTKRKRTRKQ